MVKAKAIGPFVCGKPTVEVSPAANRILEQRMKSADEGRLVSAEKARNANPAMAFKIINHEDALASKRFSSGRGRAPLPEETGWMPKEGLDDPKVRGTGGKNVAAIALQD